jgi:hypothetical protein
VRWWLATLLVAGLACTKPPNAPVCGLHSAAAPLLMRGESERMIAVGSKLSQRDAVKAQGPTLLECFGGAIRVLEKGDSVVIGEMTEAKIEAVLLPRYVISNFKLKKLENAPPAAVQARYTDTRYTPPSAVASDEPTSGDYLRAFFTPNGLATLGSGPKLEGPSSLPAPHLRIAVPHVHAGPLGASLRRLEVDDDFVFAETDDLATAVLLEDEYYDLGRTVRLVLPDGAEATLVDEGQKLELEGPMDVRLR